jgi:hypothetical protein
MHLLGKMLVILENKKETADGLSQMNRREHSLLNVNELILCRNEAPVLSQKWSVSKEEEKGGSGPALARMGM